MARPRRLVPPDGPAGHRRAWLQPGFGQRHYPGTESVTEVSKRCENIRNRYVRLGVAGLRGPRALEELAVLLISTGELTTKDLRRLPRDSPG